MAPSRKPSARKKWINKKPLLTEAMLHFEQEQDCCDGDTAEGMPQELLVKVSDGGGGAFLVLETKRWAFDSVEELKDLIKPIEKLIADFPSD